MKKILSLLLLIFIITSSLISCTNTKCNHVDDVKDHICDICGGGVGTHADKLNDGDHKCDYCESVLSLCADNDKNHECDECKANVGEHSDTSADKDHLCDYCQAPLPICVDNDLNHKCDECDAAMCEHSDSKNDKDHLCDYCYMSLNDCVDANKDFICDECEKKLPPTSDFISKWGTTFYSTVDSDEVDFNVNYDNYNAKVLINAQNIILAPGTYASATLTSHIFGQSEITFAIKTDATITLSGWEVNDEFYCPLIFKIGASKNSAVEINASNYTNKDSLIKAIENEIEAISVTYEAGTNIPEDNTIELYISCAWVFDDNDYENTALGNTTPHPNISISITQTIEQQI